MPHLLISCKNNPELQLSVFRERTVLKFNKEGIEIDFLDRDPDGYILFKDCDFKCSDIVNYLNENRIVYRTIRDSALKESNGTNYWLLIDKIFENDSADVLPCNTKKRRLSYS